MEKMNPVNAFLLASGIAYYCCLPLPKPCTKNIKNIWVEKLGLFLLGTAILVNLLKFNVSWGWLVMGMFWTFSAVASYLGYMQWNVLWIKECPKKKTLPVSDAAQMTMWLWDILIAVSCLTKVSII